MAIGENLVASYLRYIEKCSLVVENTQLEHEQGEVDVIGVTLGAELAVVLCEVTTHIRGMQYGSIEKTIAKVAAKIGRAKDFAALLFRQHAPRYEIWSPYVPIGRLTSAFEEMAARSADERLDVQFVINEGYHERIQVLIEHARTNTAQTSDPAYRLLQILTKTRGQLTF